MFANAIVAAALTYTTFLGADAPAEPAEQVAFTYQANGAQGWVITQEGIAHDHECVIHLSLEPYRAIVVADTDPMCEAEAANLTVDMGQLGFGAKEDEFDTSGADVPGELIQVAETSVDELAWQEFQARGYVSSVFVPADIYTEVTGK